MSHWKLLRLLPLPGGVLLFLLCPRAAAEGVRAGLRLCGELLIPGLFPLSVLAGCLLRLGVRDRAEALLGPWMGRQFFLSGSCALPLAAGLLGGFPLGPQVLADLLREGAVSRQEGERLSAFCNNAGPAFLLGTLGAGILGQPRLGLALLAVQALGAWMTGRLLRPALAPLPRPGRRRRPGAPAPSLLRVLPLCAGESALAMLRLTGIVCFFQALLGPLEALLPLQALPLPLRALLTGLLELSSGVSLLRGMKPALAFPLACVLVGWGGLCVQLQGAAALEGAALSPVPALMGKALQGLICGVLGWLGALLAPLPGGWLLTTAAWGGVCLLISAISEKSHWKTEKAVV